MLKNKCCLYVIISIRFFSITICNLLIEFPSTLECIYDARTPERQVVHLVKETEYIKREFASRLLCLPNCLDKFVSLLPVCYCFVPCVCRYNAARQCWASDPWPETHRETLPENMVLPGPYQFNSSRLHLPYFQPGKRSWEFGGKSVQLASKNAFFHISACKRLHIACRCPQKK